MHKQNRKTSAVPSQVRSPPPPAPIAQSNPQQSTGFLGNMIQGMALGAGSSIGHKMVDGLFNGKEQNEEKKDEPNKIENIYMDHYIQCMKDKNDVADCKVFADMYISC